MQIAWRGNTNLRCMVFFCGRVAFFFGSLRNFLRYIVAPRKQFDIGNYAFTLLAPVRLVSKKISLTYEKI